MQITTFPIVLENTYMASPQVKHFVFKCSHSPAFNYLPGQFITILFEHEGKPLRRSYSIANAPKQDNRIEFAAGYVAGGPGTDLLFNLNQGDTIQIMGPFGRLILKEEIPNRYILVSTSTGVTPYRAMLMELQKRLENHPELHIVVLQGVQKREDVLHKEDFLALAKQFPNVQFKAHLSRESAENLAAHEAIGYVQTAFPSLALDPKHDLVYLCGNPGMIDDAFNYLKEQGFAMQQIIREKYISK